jgi:two-component system, NtrC family, sensor kinase
VRSTLTLARNEYKYVADLATDFGALPPVTCIAGSISQVVLNLVVNAAHAVGDVVKASGGKGHIAVSTHLDGDHAVITVRDNGNGIADHVRPHIFEPFYTTKAVGKGTGQGLALAWSIVAGDHAGAIEVDSASGQGATFRVRLPIAGRAAARQTAEAA